MDGRVAWLPALTRFDPAMRFVGFATSAGASLLLPHLFFSRDHALFRIEINRMRLSERLARDLQTIEQVLSGDESRPGRTLEKSMHALKKGVAHDRSDCHA